MTRVNETDVLIVGGGGSGLACAAAAAEQGLRVVVLEKRPELGGATGIAIGSFTASQTRIQQSAGIDDTPQQHEEDAGKFGPAEYQNLNNSKLREFFLSHGSETLNWLEGLGLVFHGPYPEPPNRVPRMHNVAPNAKAYIAVLQSQVLRHGGQLICDAEVNSLTREGRRVTGATYRRHGQDHALVARLGVVLAAGDYSSAPDLIAKHRGEKFALVEGINPHASGDGHRLAEQVGANLVNMQITYGPELRFVASSRRPFTQLLPASGWAMRAIAHIVRWSPRWVLRAFIRRLLVTWQHPEDALFADGAILINQQGARFCNELDGPTREIAVAAQDNKQAYLLLDESLAHQYSQWPHFISTAPEIAYAYVRDYLRLRPDVAVAGTLAEVAAHRNLPPAVVAATVAEYSTEIGGRDRFLRSQGRPLTGHRWVLLGPVKAYFTTTEGGVAINQKLEAMNAADEVIPGLYAIGQSGLGGMVLWGHGLHIAWAITSGRLLGHQLAQKTPAQAPQR